MAVKTRTRPSSAPAPVRAGAAFSEAAASRAVRFFSAYLRHIKGTWTGQPFILLPWQEAIVRDLFGWLKSDGTRLYRRCYLEIPRGAGKSSWAAGVGLYLLFADGEGGSEVYSAAADRQQAREVFDTARRMVEGSPALLSRSEVWRSAIAVPSTGSSYRVLSADAHTKHGQTPHGLIFDELHAQPNRDLYDTLTSGLVKRPRSLLLMITTAGYDRESICWEVHDYACKVRDGIIDDPEFLPVLYGAPEDADWTDPKVWRAANPSLGITVREEDIAAECRRAQETPGYVNTFRRLHLCSWTESSSRWLDMAAWEDGGAGPLDLDALTGQPCWAGLDLSTTTDISALVLAFKGADGGITLLPYFWVPEEGIAKRAQRDRVPYDVWARDGDIEPTEGNVVDYQVIRRRIRELGASYGIQEIAFDPWNATSLANDLQGDGFRLIQMRQGFLSLNEPSKALEKLVVSRKLHHGGNPVLRWMASNVVVETDAAGNIKPSKAKSTERIDGIVAAIMAISRAMVGDDGRSVYESRGLATL